MLKNELRQPLFTKVAKGQSLKKLKMGIALIIYNPS